MIKIGVSFAKINLLQKAIILNFQFCLKYKRKYFMLYFEKKKDNIYLKILTFKRIRKIWKNNKFSKYSSMELRKNICA